MYTESDKQTPGIILVVPVAVHLCTSLLQLGSEDFPQATENTADLIVFKFSPKMFLIPAKRRTNLGTEDDIVSGIVEFYEWDAVSSHTQEKKDSVILRENEKKKRFRKCFFNTMTVG